MRHRGFTLMLVAVVFALLPSRSHASFHQVYVVEVFPGTAARPNAQYIMLQMYFPGQNLVAARSLTVFGAHDEVLANLTFTTNVANGADQATILIGTTEANTLFGIPRDLVMNAVIPLNGGKICWAGVDACRGAITPAAVPRHQRAARRSMHRPASSWARRCGAISGSTAIRPRLAWRTIPTTAPPTLSLPRRCRRTTRARRYASATAPTRAGSRSIPFSPCSTSRSAMPVCPGVRTALGVTTTSPPSR